MYNQIAANKHKTVYLIVGFIAFIALVGYVMSRALGSPGFIWFALIFGIVYAVIGYYASAKVALALAGAKPIAKADAPKLYRIVENLAITAGLPMPQVYIINDPAPNAFATGRDPKHAVVAATTGLLDMMEDEELEGVIAHELSHVGNYDIRVMALVIVLVTIISVVSDLFFRMTWFRDEDEGGSGVFMLVALALSLLSPIIASLLQLAVSRKREYLADASGALLTRYPEGLIGALEKIDQYKQPMRRASNTTAHLYFANPFRGKAAGFVAGLFSTHPPITDRIAKLQQMEGGE